jgi:hypothetical protein
MVGIEQEGSPGMDEFEAITAELRAQERGEQVEHAREILAAADADRDYADVLRRIAPGEVVVVATADGWVTRGRVVRVGRDWLRVAEVRDEVGTARVAPGRVHEVRLGAVIRISRGRDR